MLIRSAIVIAAFILAGSGVALPVRGNPDDPKAAAGLLKRGDLWYEASEYDKAIMDYTEALRLDPNLSAALVGRGMARRAKGDFAGAVKDLDAAIRLDPKDPRAFFGRGATRMAEMKLDEAIDDFTEALRLDPRYAHALIQRAFCRAVKGLWDDALKDAEAAVKLAPGNPAALYARGMVRQGKQEWAGAVADFDEVIRLDPSYAPAYANRAMIRAACPDPKFRDGAGAVGDGRRACELSGWKDPFHLAALAAGYAESGDFAAAVKWQKKVLEEAEYVRWHGAAARDQMKAYEARRPYRLPGKAGE